VDSHWHLDVSHQLAFHSLEQTITMIGLTPILLQTHPREGWFFSSGKALVVLAVTLMLLVGFGIWMWRAEARLKKMERLLNTTESNKQ
jgi:hypothetical protein